MAEPTQENLSERLHKMLKAAGEVAQEFAQSVTQAISQTERSSIAQEKEFCENELDKELAALGTLLERCEENIKELRKVVLDEAKRKVDPCWSYQLSEKVAMVHCVYTKIQMLQKSIEVFDAILGSQEERK